MPHALTRRRSAVLRADAPSLFGGAPPATLRSRRPTLLRADCPAVGRERVPAARVGGPAPPRPPAPSRPAPSRPALPSPPQSVFQPVRVLGYATVWNLYYEHWGRYERFRPRAFSLFLGRREPVLALLEHDVNRPLAGTEFGTLSLWQDEIGLACLMTLDASHIWCRKALEGLRSGQLAGMSLFRSEFAAASREIDGAPVREICVCDITEVSLAREGANPAAQALIVEDVRAGTLLGLGPYHYDDPAEQARETARRKLLRYANNVLVYGTRRVAG